MIDYSEDQPSHFLLPHSLVDLTGVCKPSVQELGNRRLYSYLPSDLPRAVPDEAETLSQGGLKLWLELNLNDLHSQHVLKHTCLL